MSLYDVIIVGGGIAGATAALALAKQTALQIALIDEKSLSPTWQEAKYATRVSAISHTSKKIFENLQIWNAIQEKRVSPYDKMQVWDENGEGKIQFASSDINALTLGHIIENDAILLSLLENIAHHSNITLLAPLKLTNLVSQAEGIELLTADGQILRAKLIIAADGGLSWVRQQAGIAISNCSYEHTAIVATVRTSLPHQSTAWQRFLSSGPLAFLPLADTHQCSIVWSTQPDQARELLSLDDDTFQKKLASAFAYQLGEITAIQPRTSFSLEMRHAKNYVQNNIALIGDAAHTIHPLAGQGVNMGLLDVACLVDVIMDALAKKRDFSHLATLRRYERWRKGDNMLMLAMVDVLKKVFGSDKKMLQKIRNLGLNAIDNVGLVKNYFIHCARGQRGDLPRLAQ